MPTSDARYQQDTAHLRRHYSAANPSRHDSGGSAEAACHLCNFGSVDSEQVVAVYPPNEKGPRHRGCCDVSILLSLSKICSELEFGFFRSAGTPEEVREPAGIFCGGNHWNDKRRRDSMAPKGSTQKQSSKGPNHGAQAPKMKTLFSFFGKKDPPAVAPSSSPPDDSSAPKPSLQQPQLDNSHLLTQLKVGSSVIQVYWSQDEAWYSAKIVKQRGSSSRFYIEYTQDGQCEWIDLNTERFRLAQETTKKRGRNIQVDDDDEEFEMPDNSEEEGEIDDDEDDDQWMVTDDEDDAAAKKTKGFKKLKTSSASSRVQSSKTPPSRTTTPKAVSKAKALSLQVFAAGGGPVDVTQVGTKTPGSGSGGSSSADRMGRNRLAADSAPQPVTPGTGLSKTSPFQSSPPLPMGSATATSRTPGAVTNETATASTRSPPPPPFVVGALNPAGSHVHNHLAFLQHPVDAQGRSADHVDYDPRTLRVNDKDWVKLMGKPMTDAVKQWWDLKKMYFDTILLFKTGECLRGGDSLCR
jgi:hypothetical protein